MSAGCNAVSLKEYGVVEAEGTPGYHSARIGLRAPRVAVRVESAHHWQSMFALAMWMAAGWWGGYGFIYLPRGTGRFHPALTAIVDNNVMLLIAPHPGPARPR